MSKKEIFKYSFKKSIPILCSYLFLSLAYGISMQSAGFNWYLSALISLLVYTGAFQFVLISLLSSQTSIITIAITALLMGSRQVFYSIPFLKDFNQMASKKLYMIHSLTDETFAINTTIDLKGEEKRAAMFYLAILSQSYWVSGSILGGIIGNIIPFSLEGIDFCMTALFVIIFIDQWQATNYHLPAIIGLGLAIICLFIFNSSNFMLPALLLTSGILLLLERRTS